MRFGELQERVEKLNQAYEDLDDDEPFIGRRKRNARE
jgi:cell division protein FtsB